MARKLDLKQSEIVEFLSAKGIEIEDGANTKIEHNHLDLIVKKFSAFNPAEEVANVRVEKDEGLTAPVIVPVEITFTSVKDEGVDEATPISIPEYDEKQKVIKAAKVELQGLKVLGKIDLPEFTKKAKEETAASDQTVVIPELSRPILGNKRQAPSKPFKTEPRPRKNPIALAREQEGLEARKRREAEAELAKEQRTKNYYKKVKGASPTRRARIIEEQSEEMVMEDVREIPKTWLGKLVRWFRT